MGIGLNLFYKFAEEFRGNGQMTLSRAKEILAKDNANFDEKFVEMNRDVWAQHWPSENGEKPWRVYRNQGFMVQFYRGDHGMLRMTVNRTTLKALGWWDDGITWDELQVIKSDCGFGDRDAVEVYPKDSDVILHANMRHLWILPKTHDFDFIWRKSNS